jgi:hypothetical protein
VRIVWHAHFYWPQMAIYGHSKINSFRQELYQPDDMPNVTAINTSSIWRILPSLILKISAMMNEKGCRNVGLTSINLPSSRLPHA